MPHLTSFDWLLAIFGAVGIGVAKSGFSGVSMLHVLIFASLCYFAGRMVLINKNMVFHRAQVGIVVSQSNGLISHIVAPLLVTKYNSVVWSNKKCAHHCMGFVELKYRSCPQLNHNKYAVKTEINFEAYS